jgi:hypothetical protein
MYAIHTRALEKVFADLETSSDSNPIVDFGAVAAKVMRSERLDYADSRDSSAGTAEESATNATDDDRRFA